MTFQIKRPLLAASVAAAIVAPATGFATNGMNLEGYGPIATGMGGASMAYDNGVAAVMNNPATLGLMEDGEGRFDVAIGSLDPDITSSATGAPDAPSTAGPFYMPAIGYATKNGALTYGVGMSAQGGMGTEYGANSFLTLGSSGAVPSTLLGGASIDALGGVRSEVGVGRLVAPIVYNVDKNFSVGGSIDYVWAGMDLKMAMSSAQINTLAGGGFVSGSLAGSLPAFFTGLGGDAARFDFSNDNDFTGEATGDGFAGKIGFTFKVNKNLTVGATYHSETSLGDLETSNASMTVFNDTNFTTPAAFDGFENATLLEGDVVIKDFQWPSTLGVGISYAEDKWMVAADVKQINWSDVMAGFTMEFKPHDITGNPLGTNGGNLIMTLPQNWDDQTVIQVGGAYKVSSDTTLRAGINSASNPVPDATVNPLFPATIETHYTLGVGYAVSKNSGVDFSLTIAPEVSVDGDSGVTTTHSQTNWQFMYSQKF